MSLIRIRNEGPLGASRCSFEQERKCKMDINELMKPIHEYKTKKAKFDGTCQASNFINLLDIKAAISFLEAGYSALALERLKRAQKDLESLLEQAKELDAEFDMVYRGN